MKTHYYHYAALTGYFGLFGLLMLWNTVLAPSRSFSVALVWLILVLTPLLLPLRGLLKADKKNCAWAAYVSLLYFLHGTDAVYNHANGYLLASFEVFFSLILFFGATFYVRFIGRANKQ